MTALLGGQSPARLEIVQILNPTADGLREAVLFEELVFHPFLFLGNNLMRLLYEILASRTVDLACRDC